MSDPSASDAATADPAPNRLDELIEQLRAAYAPDATPEARYATAVRINRSLLGTAPPPGTRNAAAPASQPSSAGLPVDALINAMSTAPREQLVAVVRTVAPPLLEALVSHARTIFAQTQPSYLPRPVVTAPTLGRPTVTTPPRSGRKS